ncbi:MAG: tetratricopeptide repeat protein [Myxococcota bacterium]
MRRIATRIVAILALLVAAAAPARADFQDDLESASEALRAWDMPAAEQAVDRALSARPSDRAALTLSGRLHLMQGRYATAVEHLEQAVHLGAGGTAEHFRRLAHNVLEETRGYQEHLTADGHFLIRYPDGVEEVMVPYVEEVLEGAWERLVPVFEHEPPTPVRVEIYPEVDVLGAVSSLTVDEIKTSGTIALCKYNRLMFTSPRDLVYGYGWADTLAHEFIHLLITQKSANRVPIWLHEGLAKYFEAYWEGRQPALERRSEDLLARALEDDALIPFEEMSPSMAKLPSQEATATAFAEVFTVIGFLVSRGGDAVAERLVSLMGDGVSDQDAVAKVAGLSWRRFEPTWRRHLERKRLRTMDDAFDMRLLFKGHDTEADELQALKGEAARKHVWLGDRMRLRERWKAASREYRKAVGAVGDETPIVQAKLGHALLKLGLVEEAAAALEPPLSLYPDYMLLRVYLGEAHLRLGNLEEARRHLEHAIRINPFDPDVHGHLAAVYRQLGEDALAERETRAHELVRQR